MNLNIKDISEKLQQFATDRQWDQFHTPKNLAGSISIEASELLEIFQWTKGDKDWSEFENSEFKTMVSYELADIIIYAIRFSDLAKINLNEAVHKKIAINNEKYPVEEFINSDRKYNHNFNK